MNFALGPVGADKQRTGSHWFMLFMLFCCRRRRRLCCLCCSSHTGVAFAKAARGLDVLAAA
jgi:hypothetical protein